MHDPSDASMYPDTSNFWFYETATANVNIHRLLSSTSRERVSKEGEH
jgi:hypothetical protein